MRTPTLALVAFAAFSTGVVTASPLPLPGSYNSHVYAVSSPETAPDTTTSRLHPKIGTKVVREPVPDHAPSLSALSKIAPRELLKRALDAYTTGRNAYYDYTNDVSGGSVVNDGTIPHSKRTDDNGTLGGNAYTGNSGDVNGGDIVNQGDNYGMPTLFNMNSNNGGAGGDSIAGCAHGGHGNGSQSGGNAYSGSSGEARGGEVYNSGGVANFDSNNAGDAGRSQSGCATGGDVLDNPAAA